MADTIIKDEKTIVLTAGVLILITLVGISYIIDEPDKLFECNIDDNIYVALCDEVSGTRCYYYVNTTIAEEDCEGTYYFYEDEMCYNKRWKICSTGWEKSDVKEATSVVGTEVKEIKVEPFSIKTDFTDKVTAEAYITDLKSTLKNEVSIGKTYTEPYSKKIKVMWSIKLYKQLQAIEVQCLIDNETFEETCIDAEITIKEIAYQEEFYTKFSSDSNFEEINNTITKNANEVINQWMPKIEIEIK